MRWVGIQVEWEACLGISSSSFTRMTRQKYYILLFFISIPFPLLLLFKTPLSEIHDRWPGQAYPYLVLLAALAEVYFSRNKLVIVGLVGMGAAVLGLFLLMLHWPGAWLFVVAGIAILMIIPLWSAVTTKEPKALRVIISNWILTYGVGTVFKIFHWPAAGLLIILSLIVLPVVTVALGISLWNAKQKQNDRNV